MLFMLTLLCATACGMLDEQFMEGMADRHYQVDQGSGTFSACPLLKDVGLSHATFLEVGR